MTELEFMAMVAKEREDELIVALFEEWDDEYADARYEEYQSEKDWEGICQAGGWF